MADHIYGIHDFSPGWAQWVRDAEVTGWCVTTHSLSEERQYDFSSFSSYGITPIARLNWGYGSTGTIPKSEQYGEFANRCRNFVEHSVGCKRFIIGNEPNWSVEWPDDQLITPEQYVECYRLVYSAIKSIGKDTIVIPAPVAPWNVESGMDWISYWNRVLNLIGTSCDSLAIHTYSRGYDPSAVVSEDRMNNPYSQYRNGFKTYLDFLDAVPDSLRSLPVHITETNGNEPWPNDNKRWVQEAYAEINRHNQKNSVQKIHSLNLFRWPKFDAHWQFETRTGVHQDFRIALSEGYRIRKSVTPSVLPDKGKDLVRTWDTRLGKNGEEKRGVKLVEADVKPGEEYWRVTVGEWLDVEESQGRHHIFVDVLDKNGKRITGIPVRFYWVDEDVISFTQEKSGENYSVDFPMHSSGWGFGVGIEEGKSDCVERLGMGTIEEPHVGHHTSYRFVFQKVVKEKEGNAISLPIVSPGPDPIPTTPSGYKSGWKATVIPDLGLNLRSGPSIDDPVVTTLPKNAKLSVRTSIPKWLSVEYEGDAGYVSSEYVTIEPVGSVEDSEDTTLSSVGSQSPEQIFWDEYGPLVNLLAKQYTVPVDILAAVIMVESAGRPFDNQGKLIIRFENHIFFDVWGKDHKSQYDQHFKYNPQERWRDHFWRPDSGDWHNCHVNNTQEHEVLNFALNLDGNRAYEAISMGMPQILGVGYKTANYSNAKEMYNAFQGSDQEQLKAMLRWIANRGLIDELQDNNLYAFSVGYNGSGQAHTYSSLIEKSKKVFGTII